MNKQEIQQQAYVRMARIEDQCGDYVSPPLRAYWLLNYLIAAGLETYFGTYGMLTIAHDMANEGRTAIGLGPLSSFETETIHVLNQKIQERESIYAGQRKIQLISNCEVQR